MLQWGVIVAVVLIVAVLVVRWWRRHANMAATNALARSAKDVAEAPSREFKLLRSSEEPAPEVAPEAPRLENDGEMIFGETSYAGDVPIMPADKEEVWALEHVMRRTPSVRTKKLPRLVAVLVVVVALALLALQIVR